MTLPLYPDYLPLPLKFTRSNQTGEAVMRTDRLKGLARQRQWTNAPTLLFEAEWHVPNEKAELFITWHANEIANGTDWFEMQSYYSGTLAERRTRFTGMYSGPDPIGVGHVKFTAQLEVFERPVIPPEWLEAPEWWYNLEWRSIFDFAMNHHWPEWEYSAMPEIFDLAINQEWPTP